MIDIAQLPTPSSTASTVAPAAAGGAASPSDGKESGFQSVIGKVMNSGDAPAEHGQNGAKDPADPALPAEAKNETLPVDGTNLPLFPFLPVAPLPVTPVAATLAMAGADGQEAAADVAVAEGGEMFSLDARGRLNALLRGAAGNGAQPGGAPAAAPAAMPAGARGGTPAVSAAPVDDLAAAGAGALPGTAALFADDIAAKLQAQTPHAYESAAAPLLLNTLDTSPAYQNTSFGTQPLTALSSMLQPTAAAGATPPPVGTPVQQSDWGDDLGSRITWMIKQDVTAADIKLNPPHLGPLEVKISMSQDQVSVAFTSHHAVVRDALDTALPRLREMLSDNGLQLANANVSNKSAADQGGSQHYGAGNQGGGQRGAAGNGDGEDGALAVTAALPGAGRYLVDYYA